MASSARVHLWLKVVPQDRKELFNAACAELVEFDKATDPELLDALEVFAAIRSQKKAVRRKRLLRACDQCYNWATRHSYLRTAVTFAELSASGAPEDANRQTVAGRANRQLGAFERAARWFDRAIALARVKGDQAAFADALLTWGSRRSSGPTTTVRGSFSRERGAAANALIYERWARSRGTIFCCWNSRSKTSRLQANTVLPRSSFMGQAIRGSRSSPTISHFFGAQKDTTGWRYSFYLQAVRILHLKMNS